MTYVDGFLVPVPDGNKEAYLGKARFAAEIFVSHGATRVVETWSDDVPDGKITDFRKSVRAEPGEAVVFSWIEWPSKAARDAGMKASMEDERMKPQMSGMPFDGKRLIYGGFATILDHKG